MLVDYTEELIKSRYYGSNVDVVLAQGKGKNFLVVLRETVGFNKAERPMYRYVLQYRWLSQECRSPKDEAYVCVKGSEVQHYSARDLNKIDRKILKGEADLFSCFNLF